MRDSQEQPIPSDVVASPAGDIERLFRAINPKEASAFSITRPPTVHLPEGAFDGVGYHQQGIQRTQQGHFVVSGSAHDAAYIYLTEPSLEVVTVIRPAYSDPTGPYNHAGGLQVVDGILAVGLERKGDNNGWSVVVFYDIRDVRSPRPLEHLTVTRRANDSTAGAVGLARYRSGWLLLVGNWDSKRLDFYKCTREDLRDAAASFAGPTSQWSKEADGLGDGSVDRRWGEYQNINVFTRADTSAMDLWFIGMHSSGLWYRDFADLYRLEYAEPRSLVTKREKAHFKRRGSGPRFDWGSGVYYDATQNRFEVFSCEQHANHNGNQSRCNRWR